MLQQVDHLIIDDKNVDWDGKLALIEAAKAAKFNVYFLFTQNLEQFSKYSVNGNEARN